MNAQDVWANADANRGWQYFGNCAACHTIGKGQRHKVGPNLFGIVGHPAGARDDYAGYTPALRDSELVWDAATLDRYLENNKLVVPGNRMACGRIPDPQIRADIITYLSLFHE
ncbi:MAG: c-type cytochrome [Rickettsiales bacterium]|nr:c-type cytochrome [Rickettsiales bacterium]